MADTDEQTGTSPDKPSAGRRFRRAAGLTLRWVISPSFFKIKSPNPFQVQGELSEAVVRRPMRQRRQHREHARQIDKDIEGQGLDVWTRDRYTFEFFVEAMGLSEADLLVRHNGATRVGVRNLVLAVLGAVAIMAANYYVATGAWGQTFLLSLFIHNPLLLAAAVGPTFVILILTSIRYLFFAYSVRQRRHGSFAAFVLWLTSPEEWFASARLKKLPAVEPLPATMVESIKATARSE